MNMEIIISLMVYLTYGHDAQEGGTIQSVYLAHIISNIVVAFHFFAHLYFNYTCIELSNVYSNRKLTNNY